MFLVRIIVLVAMISLSGCKARTSWSGRIVSKEERPLASLLNPHIGTVCVLIVDGQRFEEVRGRSGFYLTTPTSNAVVFITDGKDHSVTYHVYNMDKRNDPAIHARGSSWGSTIGSPYCCDRIERSSEGKIVLSTTHERAQSTVATLTNLNTVKCLYYLDLGMGQVAAEKILYFDKRGNVILEHDGKPPF